MDTTVTSVANKALDMLRGLAEQLGTSLQYLWPRYAQYVTAQAVADGVVWMLASLAGWIAAYWVGQGIAALRGEEDAQGTVFVMLGLPIASFTVWSSITFITKLGIAIAAGMAPEGYALTKLIATLK